MAELMSEANFSSSTYIDLALPDILNNRKDIEEVLSWDCTQILKRTTIPINKTERFTEIVRLLSDYLEKRPTWKVSQWVGFSVKLQSFRDLSNRELARIFNPKSKASRRLKNLIKMYVSGKDLTQTISYSLLKDLEPINNTNGIRRFVWKRRLSKLLDVPSSNVNESVWLEAFNESKLKKESEEARLALIDEFTIFHPEADYNYIKAVQQEVSEEDKEFIKDISRENDTKERIGGTVSSCIQAYLQGVQILRVHDIKEINQAFKVFKELQN